MSESDRPLGDDLIDDLARDWYIRSMRGGGHILDAHLTAIRRAFGPEVGYRLRVPVVPDVDVTEPDFDLIWRLPARLVIEIAQPVDDPRAWERLQLAQQDLLERSAELRDKSGSRDPFDRITMVLAGAPQDWEGVVRDIDELQ